MSRRIEGRLRCFKYPFPYTERSICNFDEMSLYHPIVMMQTVQIEITELIDKLFDWAHELAKFEDTIHNAIGFDPYEVL